MFSNQKIVFLLSGVLKIAILTFDGLSQNDLKSELYPRFGFENTLKFT